MTNPCDTTITEAYLQTNVSKLLAIFEPTGATNISDSTSRVKV